MKEHFDNLLREAAAELADATTLQKAESVKFKYLGRKGRIADLFKLLPTVVADERPEIGQLLNKLRADLESLVETKLASLKPVKLRAVVDVTLPGRKPFEGTYHPLTLVLREVVDIFRSMGFRVAEGPEIELVRYNFDMLNTPPWHPSRDETDTIYLPNGFVVRTETSPVQIRVMESQKPPVRIISPGRVYRRDRPDATHSPMFHQVEGLYVDEGVTMADLKYRMMLFAREFLWPDVKVRFRPDFFPFTEPSVELDISCGVCGGKGCSVCGQKGWVEVAGAGMVDPNVFKAVRYDPEKYTGFAFGFGVERPAMLKCGIHDIRLFYENDVRFLAQF